MQNSEDGDKKYRILVIDDDVDVCEITALILRSEGFEVVSVYDPNEALENLKHETFNLVICDIVMPDINGYSLAQEIQEKFPSLPLFLISGYTYEEHINAGISASLLESLSTTLLKKPFSRDALMEKVNWYLNSKTQEPGSVA